MTWLHVEMERQARLWSLSAWARDRCAWWKAWRDRGWAPDRVLDLHRPDRCAS